MNTELVTIDNNKIELTEEGLKKIKKFREQKLKADIMEEELKRTFKDFMEENNVVKIETPNKDFKITYVAETKAKRFDSKRFKEEHKDMYNQYQVESKKSAYVRMG